MDDILKVYISGPMTDIEEFNHPAFHEAAEQLEEEGYCVIDPARVDEADASRRLWGEYLARDLNILLVDGIDAIIALPGWEDSLGSCLEIHAASCRGIKTYLFPDFLDGDCEPVPLKDIAEAVADNIENMGDTE
jgi:hypothetical protein